MLASFDRPIYRKALRTEAPMRLPRLTTRRMMAAVAIIAVHHLLLSYLAPEWVFIGSGDLPRVLVHALAVSLVLVVLGVTALYMDVTHPLANPFQ